MLNGIERIKSEANSGNSSNLHRFIEIHPIDKSEVNIDELKKWVKSIRRNKNE